MTDPIADMLTRIRNAVNARHQRVDMPASRFKTEIARVLEQEGYIQGFRLLEAGDAASKTDKTDKNDKADKNETPQPIIRILLKYGPRGENVISGLQRVSRPGRRVYFGRNDVPRVMGGLGTSILTTSRGVMTGRDAVKAGIGGEVLCNIW
jgi:small subunit ribosomal protein S8